MSYDDYPGHDSDPASYPSEEEQRTRLAELQAQNMQRIFSDRELLELIRAKYEETHPGSTRNGGGNDRFLAIHQHGYGQRLEDGSWQEGDRLYVGFVSPLNGNMSSTSFVHVARRVNVAEGGQELVPDEGFSLEQAELLAGMADELQFAKLSGQIPDLSSNLDRIYIPSPTDDFR